MLIFKGHRAIHQAIEGRIYARVPDGMPLRISIMESRGRRQGELSRRGGGGLHAQRPGIPGPGRGNATGDTPRTNCWWKTNFGIRPFRKFGADAAIKFDVQQ